MSPVQGLGAASWPLRLCFAIGTFLFLSCTIGWIYGAVYLNSKLNSNAMKNLDGNSGKWEGQPQSRQALFNQLVAHGVDSNNIWISVVTSGRVASGLLELGGSCFLDCCRRRTDLTLREMIKLRVRNTCCRLLEEFGVCLEDSRLDVRYERLECPFHSLNYSTSCPVGSCRGPVSI